MAYKERREVPNQMQSDKAEHDEQSPAQVEAPRFVQFLFFKVDVAWRRLPEEERACGRCEFAQAVEQAEGVTTFAYSTLGLKVDTDLMLWRTASSLEELQDMLARLLRTGLG